MVNLLKARIFFKILPCLLHAVMKRQIPICCSMQAMQHTTIIKKNLIWTVDMDVVALSVYVHKVEVQNVNFKLSLELAYISGTWQLIIWQYHLDPRRRRLSCPAWLRYRVLTQNAERFLKRRTMWSTYHKLKQLWNNILNALHNSEVMWGDNCCWLFLYCRRQPVGANQECSRCIWATRDNITWSIKSVLWFNILQV